MKKITNKNITLIFLLLMAMTFFLPRETFDPHIGTDFDIFCRTYAGMSIDYDIPIITLKEVSDTKYSYIVITFLVSQLKTTNNLNKAPPAV